MFIYIFLVFLPLLFTTTVSSSFSPKFPDRFLKSSPASSSPDEYLELARPLPSDGLDVEPSCILPVLRHDFGDTIGSPPISAPYAPPSDCPAPWSYVVLELRASCRGEQYDRIAALWLGGAEILRTSTAEPTESGVSWKVRKDVTRYSALLSRSDLNLSMMLENVVNDVFTGVYHVEVSLSYYHRRYTATHANTYKYPMTIRRPPGMRQPHPEEEEEEEEKLGSAGSSFHTPADSVIPMISDETEGHGFWFRISGGWDVARKELSIPPNTRRAVLEVYASFHGDDEFWYSNPPDSYIIMNDLSTRRGHGAFREVYAAVDGNLVGSEVAFPVIFTGGINPLFWEPVVAIGAFNLPSYEMELTPFLELLLDGNSHEFRVGVTHSVPFWLVGANLHLWLDPSSERVQAAPVVLKPPHLSIERNYRFNLLDGSFEIEAERNIEASGWVQTPAGNFTTRVFREFRFDCTVRYHSNGTHKTVDQDVKSKTEVRVVSSETGVVVDRTYTEKHYPLRMNTITFQGTDQGGYMVTTNLSHAVKETTFTGKEKLRSIVSNSQDLRGWMTVKDHSVLSGAAETQQSLSYREGPSCYLRSVAAANGRLVRDETSALCHSSW